MRVLVTGANGQLGYDLVLRLLKRGHIVLGTTIEQMDITNPARVEQVIERFTPEAVIHCAAWTAVDEAEDKMELCRRVNVYGTENIAKVCKRLGIKMLYISTDYVFDGEGGRPWSVKDQVNPINVYGQTKYEGELVVEQYVEKYFIVRTSWVFGIRGNNFVTTMLELSVRKDRIVVIDDQIGSPTYTHDLAIFLSELIESEKYGVYHASNEGFCSRYEFAKEIFRQSRSSIVISPIKSEEYITKAKRPNNSRLSTEKLCENGFKKLPVWQDALARYLLELRQNPTN